MRDAGEAEEYLNAALKEGDLELFLLALRNEAEAQGGVAQFTEKANSIAKACTKYARMGQSCTQSPDALLVNEY